MIVFLLGLLVFECYTAQNKLLVFDTSDGKGLNMHFFETLTKEDKTNLQAKETKGLEVLNYFIPAGKYKCELNSNEKQIGPKIYESKVAKLYFFNENEPNFNGAIELNFDKIQGLRKVFDRNLKLIAHRDNFEKPDQSTIVLPSSFRNILGFTEILSLCFDKNYVTIAIADDATFSQNEWEEKAWLFDDGIALQVEHELTQTVNTKCIFDVTMQRFLSRIQKYDQSDLAWYEKVLMWFDNKYFYTKGFFKGDAPYKTMRYSRSFRKRFAFVGVVSLCTIIMTVRALKLLRGK